jgi:hypothetical protein
VCDGPEAVYQKVGADGHNDAYAPAPVAFIPWALVNVPVASMLAADGTAWFEFELLRGNHDVAVLLARDSLDKARGVTDQESHGVCCHLTTGRVTLDGADVRGPWGDAWGDPITVCEVVRLVYTHATRMVSIWWRGRGVVDLWCRRNIDLSALPATHDIARMRFGVMMRWGNAMRIIGSSASGDCGERVVCISRANSAPTGWCGVFAMHERGGA